MTARGADITSGVIDATHAKRQDFFHDNERISMNAYGLAHLRPPAVLHEEVFQYLERIQAYVDPFGGKFVVHGSPVEVMEGGQPGTLVIIEFPDLDAAPGGTTPPPTGKSCPCGPAPSRAISCLSRAAGRPRLGRARRRLARDGLTRPKGADSTLREP